MYGMQTTMRNFEDWVDPKFTDEHIASSGWDSVEEMAQDLVDSIIWDWVTYLRDNDFYEIGLV